MNGNPMSSFDKPWALTDTMQRGPGSYLWNSKNKRLLHCLSSIKVCKVRLPAIQVAG